MTSAARKVVDQIVTRNSHLESSEHQRAWGTIVEFRRPSPGLTGWPLKRGTWHVGCVVVTPEGEIVPDYPAKGY